MTDRPHRTHTRWLICLVIFWATTIIYSDRQFLSLLKSTLASDIHWTDSQFCRREFLLLGRLRLRASFLWQVDRSGRHQDRLRRDPFLLESGRHFPHPGFVGRRLHGRPRFPRPERGGKFPRGDQDHRAMVPQRGTGFRDGLVQFRRQCRCDRCALPGGFAAGTWLLVARPRFLLRASRGFSGSVSGGFSMRRPKSIASFPRRNLPGFIATRSPGKKKLRPCRG